MIGEEGDIKEKENEITSKEELLNRLKSLIESKVIKRENDKFIFNFEEILEFDPFFIDFFLIHPREVIKLLEEEIRERFGEEFTILYKNLNLNENISDIRVEHLGKLVKVKGMLSNATPALMLVKSKSYICKYCESKITTEGKIPTNCSCGRKGGFINLPSETVYEDLQEIVLEENQDEIGDRSPKKTRVRLVDKLCVKEMNGIIRDGNKIEVIGIVQEIPLKKDAKLDEEICQFRIFALQVNSLENEFDETITEEDIQEIEEISMDNPLERLSNSLCPNIIGNELIKKALVLSMVSGTEKKLVDGKREKNKIHLLLVGSAGLAKTEMLQAVARRHFRGRYVSGERMSEAGVTGGVEKDELLGSWQLKSGVLPKTNGGALCFHPDTLVVINEKAKKIKDVGKKEIERMNKNTYSYHEGKLKESKVTLFSSRDYDGKMIEFVTNDRNLIVTPEHEVFDGISLNYKKAQDFKVGDSMLKVSLSINGEKGFVPEEIIGINQIDYKGKVYDLSIKDYHNFLANGFVAHNCLDELDKADRGVQKSLHTPMESGIVSINKAGIVAVLNADCTVLCGANPKNSRFDSNKPLVEQINMEPTLLSRFDLIFVMMDTLGEKEDEEIAKSIFDDKIEEVELINTNLFKKYIQHASKRKPKFSKEAQEEITKFYPEIRRMSKKIDSGIEGMPIVPRQLKGIKRLSEASAKIRLSDVVEIEDALFAIELFKYSLLKLGMDFDNNIFDMARIVGGTSVNKRQKLDVIIDELRKYGDSKSVKDFEFRAIIKGKLSVTDDEFYDLMEILKKEVRVINGVNGWRLV